MTVCLIFKIFQVFFIQNSKDKNWTVVVRMKFKNLYNTKKRLKVVDDETYMQYMLYNLASFAAVQIGFVVSLCVCLVTLCLFYVVKKNVAILCSYLYIAGYCSYAEALSYCCFDHCRHYYL